MGKKSLFKVLAMVKQLVLPTFFMTLNCADLRWNELISIFADLKCERLTDDEKNDLDFCERCKFEL